MLRRRTYDFDTFNLFVLSLIFALSEKDQYTEIRFSKSGRGLHIRTNEDLKVFQDCNREKWSQFYGFDITFRSFRDLKVTKWYQIGTFINLYIDTLINWCLLRRNRYAKER